MTNCPAVKEAASNAAAPLDYRAPGTPAHEAAVSFIERTGLQMGHRLGAAAILLMLGCVAAYFGTKEHRSLLMLAFAAADLGFVGSLVAWHAARAAGRATREMTHLLVVNAIPLVPAAVWIAWSVLSR